MLIAFLKVLSIVAIYAAVVFFGIVAIAFMERRKRRLQERSK
jgi:hypothetical protein